MSNYYENLVNIVAALYPDNLEVPRERRVEKAKEIFNTEQSARAALRVATKHVDDLKRALDSRRSTQR